MMKRRDRRQEILDLLGQGEPLGIHMLADTLAVSDETVRRELRLLEADGLIERIHGGARLSKSVEEGPFEARLHRNAAAKQRIAAAVAQTVADGESLYLDASSTAFHIAQALKGKRDLTIVTNALGVAAELGGRHGNRLYLAGGELDERYRAFFDATARAYLAQFRPGVAIVSTESVSPDAGFTDYHVGEGELCRQMIAQSRRVTMAVDASKFDRASIVAVAAFADIDRIVTDRAIDPTYAVAGAGVEWIAA
ncbi:MULTISPECIES: DeoR/GlpR family DNA-binding transcription regulator [unclassified Sphingomonas]|uniref:DeoR/GlpR family DNA-binding transcription regulator n=1 Tax=unclassified Sphingomonas TaxID=196159 RepID=UPI0006FD4B41|nr:MULTISPECIES: DeoR/GlpR family DNA-binding transcription regulator [unclassified Sphingomonas]KQM64079.1 DeoR family transcriptional regulator [Sphingomonas sp. Leaf16]KQN13326.1 DeoR family transcriptional regulator [Sphingomonas sp. Leaf29]KQN21376.1 DeoR family transcriptional regulator [Sphingomonas sp. Leaf32]